MGESQRLGRGSISPVTTLSRARRAITYVSKGAGVLGANAVGRWSLCVCCPTVLDLWIAIVILKNY